jgi:hypothetical protein
MTFFNQKEEVLQIELTQYGKYLLSKGKWKPAYYAFFDDDVIYDGKYAGLQENQAQAVDRIKETPRTKTQYIFTGIEEQVKKNLELIKQNKEDITSLKLLPKQEKHFTPINQLGKSSLGQRKAPAFLLNVLKGEIEKIQAIQSGNSPNIRTPRIDLKDSVFKRRVEKYNTSYNYAGLASEVLNRTKVFEDGKMVTIEEDYIVLEIFEKNVDTLNKNFDIEMFLIETDEKTGEEEYIQLHFDDSPDIVKNGILLDPSEIDISKSSYMEIESMRELDPFRATNYFDILADNQIQKDMLCKLITQTSQGNDSVYNSNIDCEDIINNRNAGKMGGVNDLYRSSYDEDESNKC